MMGHCRTPGMEYRGGANAGTQMPGIGGDGEQRLGGCAEQQIVADPLVLVGDRGDLSRQREDQVEVAHRQQIGFAGGKPVPCRRALTFRAIFASVWKRVTAMVEPAACVGGGDAVEGGGESGFEHVGGARFSSAQGALELGPAGFDRRQVGRVALQVKELDSPLTKSSLVDSL